MNKKILLTAGMYFLLISTSTFAVGETAPIRVACVGDSITYGATIKNRDRDSYPAQLGAMLGQGWNVKNFGVNATTMLKKGDRPYWKCNKFKKAQKFQPNIVIIMLGTNDSKPKNWKFKKEFIADYVAMVKSFQELKSKPKILICCPVPAYPGRWGISDEIIKNEVNRMVKEVAMKTGVEKIDLYYPLSKKKRLFPDTVHPNPQGAGLIAKELCKKVENMEYFEKRIYKSANGNTLAYRIHLPDNMNAKKEYPLVLLLHGSGERGADNERQLTHGARDILKYMRENKIEGFIVAPQCPGGKNWRIPGKPMQSVIQLLQELTKEIPVDKKRIYVTGLSMGGFGTWSLIEQMPKYFAAAIPICGGGNPSLAKNLINMPIWAFHGSKDKNVNPEKTRKMIAAINLAGWKPKFTEYPDKGHVGAWIETYKDKNVLKWLFSQKQ